MKNQNRPTSLYYLYGLTASEYLAGQPEFILAGIEGTRVEFMAVRNLIVIYGKLPAKGYSAEQIEKNIGDAGWLEDRIREHYGVQEAIMSGCGSLIPFKFCTIFKTKKRIREFVDEQREFAGDLLSRLQGKQEWSVKVFRNKELLKGKLGRVDPQISALIHQIKNSSDGRSFLMKKKLLQDIESAVSRFSASQAVKLIEELKSISLAARQNETFSVPEKKGEDMIANFALLLKREDVENFQCKVDAFNLQHAGGGLYARCSGPWLPYNFVDVTGV